MRLLPPACETATRMGYSCGAGFMATLVRRTVQFLMDSGDGRKVREWFDELEAGSASIAFLIVLPWNSITYLSARQSALPRLPAWLLWASPKAEATLILDKGPQT